VARARAGIEALSIPKCPRGRERERAAGQEAERGRGAREREGESGWPRGREREREAEGGRERGKDLTPLQHRFDIEDWLHDSTGWGADHNVCAQSPNLPKVWGWIDLAGRWEGEGWRWGAGGTAISLFSPFLRCWVRAFTFLDAI
jgi:hypothetical protein